MKCKKFLVALFTFLILINTAFSSMALGRVYTEGYFNYQISDKSVIITNYFGKETEVTVPNMIAGNPVSVIAAGAFLDCESVKHVNLPDTVMEVQAGAIGVGISVLYNSNTSSPVGSMPNIDNSEEFIEKNEMVQNNQTQQNTTQKDNVPLNNNEYIDAVGNADSSVAQGGAEFTAEEIELMIEALENNKNSGDLKKDDVAHSIQDDNVIDHVTKIEIETESETEIELQSETETETETESEEISETETETETESEEISESETASLPESDDVKNNLSLILPSAIVILVIILIMIRKKKK